MLEKKFITQNIKEFEVKEYLKKRLPKASFSDIELDKTPLGVRVTVSTSKPGLIVGRKGMNINSLSYDLKNIFGLENPQIEIREVKNPSVEPQVMADMIATQIEKFGPGRFRPISFKALEQIMNAGARGVEIKISGKAPGKRATTWRFKKGYLPKCGDVAVNQIKTGFQTANPKPGVIGVSVSILSPDVRMPDDVIFLESPSVSEEELKEVDGMIKESEDKKKTKKPKKAVKKKPKEEVTEKPKETKEEPVKEQKEQKEVKEVKEVKEEVIVKESVEKPEELPGGVQPEDIEEVDTNAKEE